MFLALHTILPPDGQSGNVAGLAGRNRLRFTRGKAFSPIGGNRPIDDGATVNAFPGIKNEKEIGESFQHHHAFTFRTFHVFLLGGDVYSYTCSEARAEPKCQVKQFQSVRLFARLAGDRFGVK